MGLEHKGEAVAGVIVFPALNEIVYAAKNHGAWWSDQLDPICTTNRARVSNITRLSDAYLSTTSARSIQRTDKARAYQKLSFAVDVNRCFPDCYGHYLVATGRVEIMIDPFMNVYDNAPLQSIIQEAGGTFTDLQGNPTIHNNSALSTNGQPPQPSPKNPQHLNSRGKRPKDIRPVGAGLKPAPTCSAPQRRPSIAHTPRSATPRRPIPRVFTPTRPARFPARGGNVRRTNGARRGRFETCPYVIPTAATLLHNPHATINNSPSPPDPPGLHPNAPGTVSRSRRKRPKDIRHT